MEILEAVIRSIRSYYDDNAFEMSGQMKEIKYKKGFFDSFEEEMMEPKEKKKTPKEGKVDPKKQRALANMMSLEGKQDEDKSMKEQGGNDGIVGN